jgi:CO/xanthine dehydrogenase FAD-binding subunit
MHRVLLPFEFSEPASVAEAVELVDGDRVRALAGGVDLVLKMRLRQIVPERVVSLQKIPGLDYVSVDGSGLRIGALATLRRVERAPAVRTGWPLLAEAVRSIVSMQTKVMGTVVGNLCVGTPASDVAPVLYALGARLRLAGAAGEREVPIEEFFLAPGRTAVAPHEIVTEIVVPAPAAGSAGAFLKLSKTAEDIAKVNVAVQLGLDGGACSQACIAIGSAAPTPVRAVAAEQVLVGRLVDGGAIRAAAQAAAQAVCPITDVRSTAGYREEMVRVLVRDALERALARAAAPAAATATGKEA